MRKEPLEPTLEFFILVVGKEATINTPAVRYSNQAEKSKGYFSSGITKFGIKSFLCFVGEIYLEPMNAFLPFRHIEPTINSLPKRRVVIVPEPAVSIIGIVASLRTII